MDGIAWNKIFNTEDTKEHGGTQRFPSCSFVVNAFSGSRDRKPRKFHNIRMTVRRLKTYTGAQGYVYQYYFVGKRAALPDDPEAPATEFVFDVTSDRKLTYSVSIFSTRGPTGGVEQDAWPRLE